MAGLAAVANRADMPLVTAQRLLAQATGHPSRTPAYRCALLELLEMESEAARAQLQHKLPVGICARFGRLNGSLELRTELRLELQVGNTNQRHHPPAEAHPGQLP